VSGRIFGARRSDARSALAIGSTAALPPPAAHWSVQQHATYVDDQGSSERCVGEMLRGLHWIAVRGQGKRASARGAYVSGRAREVARAQGAAIPDTGSQPTDVIDAAIEVGLFPEDERENDPTQAMALEDFAESAASVLVAPSAFVPIAAYDTYAIDQVGASGFAIGFCMEIVPSYQALRGAVVWLGPTEDEQVVGGHAQVIVGARAVSGVDCYVVWNSWGTSFGDGGFAYIPKTWLAANCFDFVGMTAGPVLS
jgi:hypothetical protein